jgi:hypothetical protein
MADSHPPVTPIVREYLDACEAFLSDQPNANHAFILARQGLIERDGKMTDDERRLVQGILHLVAMKTMPKSKITDVDKPD